MALDPAVLGNVVSALEKVHEQGVQEGRQEAEATYIGSAARVLTGNLFAASLQAAAQMLRQYDPEAARFFNAKAGEFAAWVTPPRVQATEPPDGATGVALGNAVSVKFVDPGLDPESVSDETVYVIPASGGQHLAGEVSYDPETFTVSFAPEHLLSPDTEYKVVVTGAVKAAGSMSLGTDYTFAFVTGTS